MKIKTIQVYEYDELSDKAKQKALSDWRENFDDYALQPGDDREFTNQFTEFLKKNLPIEEDKKKKPVKKARVKN